MNQKSRYLFIILLLSLTGLLVLQFFFGFQIYQQQRKQLQQELDKHINLVVQKTHTARIDKINAYFAQDIESGNYASLSLRTESGDPMLYVTDVSTNFDILSTLYTDPIMDTISESDLKNFLITKNRAHLSKGEIMFWTASLGNRITAYNDSIKITENDIQKELAFVLNAAGINNEVSVYFLDDPNKAISKWPTYISSSIIALPLMKEQFLQVYLKHPNGIIFKRIGIVVAFSIVILFLVIFSFIFLLKTLNKQRKLSQLKDDFIANVTHEMLTPMTSQRLAMERLKKEEVLKAHPMVQILDQQTKRFDEIINQIVKVSFQDDIETANFELLSPAKIVEEVLTYQQSNTDKIVNLTNEISSNMTLYIHRKSFENAVHNLINNAITYNDNTTIELNISYIFENDCHCFYLADNGIGIAKVDQDMIFEKFHRIHKEGIYRTKGLGIGLYYSRVLLRRIQGDIQLVKSSKSGTIFMIKLPHIDIV